MSQQARGPASSRASATAASLAQLEQYLLQNSIRYVIFDMDLTVTAEHSGGVLLKFDEEACDSYISSALRTDALLVMQLCRRLGLRMGVVTFQQEVDDELRVGGTVLVRQVLCGLSSEQLITADSIIALEVEEYKVMVNHQDTYHKNHMLQQLFHSWGEEFAPAATLLIDDTLRNVKAFCSIGGHGIAVHGRSGLDLGNITYYAPAAQPLAVAHDPAAGPAVAQGQGKRSRVTVAR